MADDEDAAAAAAAAVAAQPPANFAIAPGALADQGHWDYTTREGQTIFRDATAKLDYIFEGKKSSLPAFLAAVRARGINFGWSDILDITIGL